MNQLPIEPEPDEPEAEDDESKYLQRGSWLVGLPFDLCLGPDVTFVHPEDPKDQEQPEEEGEL